MLNSILFGSYCGAFAGLCYNTIKIKQQDDWEREIKEYREYDFENEKLK